MVPGDRPFGAHTVSALVLGDLDRELDEDVLIAGDSKEASAGWPTWSAAATVGRPVNCGKLELARYIEGLTPLLIAVNINNKTYCAGVRLTGLQEALWYPARAAVGALKARGCLSSTTSR